MRIRSELDYYFVQVEKFEKQKYFLSFTTSQHLINHFLYIPLIVLFNVFSKVNSSNIYLILQHVYIKRKTIIFYISNENLKLNLV